MSLKSLDVLLSASSSGLGIDYELESLHCSLVDVVCRCRYTCCNSTGRGRLVPTVVI